MKLLNNRAILIIFVAWRVLLFLPLIFSHYFLQFRKGFEYVSSLSYINSQSPINHFLLSPWANFDAIHYLSITSYGYTLYNAVFFPLFPLLIKISTLPFGSLNLLDPRQFFAVLILNSILFLFGLLIFYKLLRFDYQKNTAYLTIFFLLIFPTSFFFASLYSESLFFLLLILSFYYARKKNWFLGSIFAILLTATRFVGIAIFPALIYEFWKEEKTIFKRKFIPVLFAPLGLVSYSVFNFLMWKNPFHFSQAQEWFANNRSTHQIVLVPQTLYRYFKILTNIPISQYEWWIAFLELSALAFAAILLFIAWKKKIRLSYLIFSITALLIPISTGTLTGFPRYVLPIFPIFVVIALIKNRLFQFLYIVIGAVLLFILFTLFSKGYFVS